MNYRFGDIVLASDFRCSQLPEVATGQPDLEFHVIRSASLPRGQRWDHAWKAPHGDVALQCARDDETYRLGMPGLATFTIDPLADSIACYPAGDTSATTIEHLLIDQVLPRVLAHRGRLVLHGGAVETPTGALLFLGDSGAGKSTLCGAFAQAGHRVLGDDGVMVREGILGGFELLPTYPGLRLLPESLAFLYDDGMPPSLPVADHTPKRRIEPPAAATGTARLRAIYALDRGNGIAIAEVKGASAILALVKSSFHLHLGDPGRSRAHLESITGVADTVPIRLLVYPRDFAALASVLEAVLVDARAAEAA
jgi:hypothetical protein